MADPNNCGTCGNVCPSVNSTPICTDGTCGHGVCNAGFGDCDPTRPGCETNLMTDVGNCGRCGFVCAAGATCVNGTCSATCTPATCQSLGAICGTHADGCGGSISCGSCPSGTTCSPAGTCVGCPSGQIMCNGVCVSSSSTTNCGTCGNTCPPGQNGTPVCSGGQCGYLCNAGFADCNPSVAGCETNVSTSLTNCGGCGIACTAPANGSAMCSNGQCVTSCDPGFELVGNVCEAS